MLVADMAIGLADKNAPILMSKPIGGCHVIKPVHDAVAREQVSKIVKAVNLDSGMTANHPQRFPETSRWNIL